MAPKVRSNKASAVLLAALTATLAVAAAASAFKVPPGSQCKCVQAATAGRCVTDVRADGAGGHTCTRATDGAGCTPPWECVTAGATHVCMAANVVTSWQCVGGSGGARGGVCACTEKADGGVSLHPVSKVGGGGARSGGGGAKPPPTTPTVKPTPTPWTPASGAVPEPQPEACLAAGVKVAVNGKPWACAKSMNIGRRTAAQAYAFKDYKQNGWSTPDDWVNLAVLRDAASRLYLCVTLGSAQRTDVSTWRAAKSTLRSATRNAFYVQDDRAASGQYDSYGVKEAGAGSRLTTQHTWADYKTDGYCVDVGAGLDATFYDLSLVKGVALANVNVAAMTPYGKVASWKGKALKRERSTARLAYDKQLRVLPAKEQAAAWKKGRKYGQPPKAAIQVTLTPSCSC